MTRTTKRTQIHAALINDPAQSDAELADKLNVSRCYVTQVRTKERIPRFRDAGLTLENRQFVEAEAKACNVTVAEIMNAIITDARLDL